jgi:hypothetical protein
MLRQINRENNKNKIILATKHDGAVQSISENKIKNPTRAAQEKGEKPKR